MRLCGLIFLAVLFLCASASGQSSHMSKVTCGAFLKLDSQAKAVLIAWLRGCHSGKRHEIESAAEEVSPYAYGGKLARHCAENPAALLIAVSEEILAEGEQ